MWWHWGSLLHELGLVVSHALQPDRLILIGVHHLGRHQMRVHACRQIIAASQWVERYVLVLLLLMLELGVLRRVVLLCLMMVSLTLIRHIGYADRWVTDSLAIVCFRVAAGSLVLWLSSNKLWPVWIDHFLVLMRLAMSCGQRQMRSPNVRASLQCLQWV